MCGVAGIFAYGGGSVDVHELTTIRDHMRARGPDGKGSWRSEDGRVGLGHRRLSIIDLSERGAQPMASVDGQLVISFNGEIYNHLALRQQLERQGRSFRSTSDTEVLLQLYDERGEAMFNLLRGMYAFALWDARRGALLLARDPYGIKPMFYADDGTTVRAASQVKALLAGGRVSKHVDLGGVAGFYVFGSVPEPLTHYRDVRCLPAGHFVWIDERGVSGERAFFSMAREWSEAADARVHLDNDELQDKVRDALRDTVDRHLVADVPVGAFLSAGVDSGSLLALMKDSGQREIKTVTLRFAEFEGHHNDEAPLAEKVAHRFGTDHSTRVITPEDFRQARGLILDAMDQPSIDGFNTWFVSRIAHEHGLKVALSGLGGDELFGGYDTFTKVKRWVRTLALPSRLPLLGRSFSRGYRALLTHRLPLSPKVAGLLQHGGTYASAYMLKRAVFLPEELGELMGEEEAREGLARLRPVKRLREILDPDPGTPFTRIAALEASMYMRNQLLRDSDWASMAHSLEVRVPFVDVALLRALAPYIAGRSDLRGKELVAGSPSQPLPDEVVRRAKTGFVVPVQSWLDGSDALQSWRRVPSLARPCHWARRLAYALQNPE